MEKNIKLLATGDKPNKEKPVKTSTQFSNGTPEPEYLEIGFGISQLKACAEEITAGIKSGEIARIVDKFSAISLTLLRYFDIVIPLFQWKIRRVYFESFQRNTTAGGDFRSKGQGHTDSRVECRVPHDAAATSVALLTE